MLRNWLIKTQLRYQISRCSDKAMQSYYQACFPLLTQTIKEVPMLALDLEMTGLNPKQDQIISIGLVPFVNGKIKLKQAQHKLIKIEGSVGQSATIHGVVDADLQQALSLCDAMQWLITEATGKVLVAHHAPLDLSFIEQALLTHCNKKYRLFAIDTLQIEHQRLLRKQPLIKKGELRLTSCRERYKLPNYEAHNALVDALSCAELLLAQVSKMGGLHNINVCNLIR